MRPAPVLAFLAGAVAFAPRAPAARCLVRVLNADRGQSRDVFNNGSNINYDAAGNVQLRCSNQNVFLSADSLSAMSGDYVHLFGRVSYRDTSYRFTADTALYNVRLEKLEARGHVHVLDKTSGSTLNGPSVDYWRAVKGVNDSARVDAILRPTVRFFARTTPVDTVHQRPYLLSGQTLRGFGQSRLWGNGNVTLDRDSIHGTGDSLSFLHDKNSTASLWGAPARLWRIGADSFDVTGKEIRAAAPDDHLRDMRAFLSARIRRGASDVTGDTVQLAFADDKVALTLAWSRDSGAALHSGGFDVRGDSLAVETPGEQLREVRVFRRGMIQSPRDSSGRLLRIPGDSTPPDTLRNTIWGDRMLARFGQVDSAAMSVTRLRQLEAYGNARSLFSRTVEANGHRTPSINYIQHADTLTIVMRGGDTVGVAAVQARGHVNGAQFETASVRRPKGDSTKAVVPGAKP